MNWKLSRPLTLIPVIIFALLTVTAGCGEKRIGKNIPAHDELLNTIRQTCSGIGIEFSAESGESAKDSNLVTLHDVTVSINTSSLKDFRAGDSFKAGTLPIKMKSIVFNYSPKENYLGLVSIKDMDMEWKFEVPSSPANKLMAMGLNLKAQDIRYDEYDISPLLTSGATSVTELAIELFANANAMKSVTRNMVYELQLSGQKNKPISLLMEFSKIEGSQSMNPAIFLNLYTKKEKNPPDFNKILEQGSPVFDLSLACGPLKVNFTSEGQRKGGGEIDGLSFSYFLKPDESRKNFTYGMHMEINNMNASISGNKTLSLLSRVKEFKAVLSVVNLSAGFAQAYFQLMKKSSEMSGKATPEAIRKAQTAMGMKIFMEFMKSKPGIEFSIAPFVHELGELEAHGKFRFSGISIPAGKAKLKIKNANRLLDTLKNTENLPPFIAKLVTDTLAGMLKIDENGDGLLVFETRENFPGQVFINGKAIRN